MRAVTALNHCRDRPTNCVHGRGDHVALPEQINFRVTFGPNMLTHDCLVMYVLNYPKQADTTMVKNTGIRLSPQYESTARLSKPHLEVSQVQRHFKDMFPYIPILTLSSCIQFYD